MKIISHRGLWQNNQEKNTLKSFEYSFQMEFGIETDIRDAQGKIVISHDPPKEPFLFMDNVFNSYKKFNADLLLALNIKADGLQDMLSHKLNDYSIKNYFVFDMSIPETIQYLKNGFNVFTRQSEFEQEPLFYDKINGVWIDCFTTDWVDEKTIQKHLKERKKVCLVSPELHKRPFDIFWERLLRMALSEDENVILCTDKPLLARDFFNGKN